MFSNLKLRDAVLIIVLIVITGVSGYLYVNVQARNKLIQSFYPIEAKLALLNLTCSEGSPSWMSELLVSKTKYQNAPANQIAYIDPQGNLYHCESGYIDRLPIISKPVDLNTRFRYASVTKLWTADAILDLVKVGKLSLDTKLYEVLKQINKPKDERIKDITIRQLLTHRAGFDRYSISGNDMFGIGQDICPNHLDKLNTINLDFDPDGKTSYSNLGYCLLGEVIDQLNDSASYSQIIAKNYNFKDTSLNFVSNVRMVDEVDYNYIEAGLTGYNDIYTAFNYDDVASVAGLSGNAIDLAHQVHQMANKPEPNILTIDSVSNCHLDQLSECYGYAMQPYQPNENMAKTYYRSGNLLGLSSWVAVSDNGSVVALLSNGTPDNIKNDGEQLQKTLYKVMNASNNG